MDRALWFTGLTSGACHSVATLNPMVALLYVVYVKIRSTNPEYLRQIEDTGDNEGRAEGNWCC